MLVPSETLWSQELRDYADFVFASFATDARRSDVAYLLGNANARRVFIDRWRTRRSYLRRCRAEPDRFQHDPESLDRAVVELRSYARFTWCEQWPELFELFDEITCLADQTRAIRQQLHASRWRATASA